MTQIPDAAVQAFRQSFESTDNNCETYQDVRKALIAAMPYLLLGYEVKQSEWVAGDGISAAKSYYEAKANGLTYCVIDGQCWIEGLGISIQKIGTDKEAKAAAQANFERRVRECLEPVSITKSSGCVFNDLGIAKPVDVAAVRRQAFDEAYNSLNYIGMNRVACLQAQKAIRALSAEPAQGGE